jgi:hypothetical protein
LIEREATPARSAERLIESEAKPSSK